MNLFILFRQNGVKVHRLPSPDCVTTCLLTSPALGAKEGRTTDLVSRVTVAKVLDFPEKHCFRTSAKAAPVGCEPLRLSVKCCHRCGASLFTFRVHASCFGCHDLGGCDPLHQTSHDHSVHFVNVAGTSHRRIVLQSKSGAPQLE